MRAACVRRPPASPRRPSPRPAARNPASDAEGRFCLSATSGDPGRRRPRASAVGARRNRRSRTRRLSEAARPLRAEGARPARAARVPVLAYGPAMPPSAPPSRRMRDKLDAASCRPFGSAGCSSENAFLSAELRDAMTSGTSGPRSSSCSRAKHPAKSTVPANSDFSKYSLMVSGLPLGRCVKGPGDRRAPDAPPGSRAALGMFGNSREPDPQSSWPSGFSAGRLVRGRYGLAEPGRGARAAAPSRSSA